MLNIGPSGAVEDRGQLSDLNTLVLHKEGLDLIVQLLLSPEMFVDELAPVVLQVVAVLHPPHDLKHLGPAHGIVDESLDLFCDDFGRWTTGLDLGDDVMTSD